MMASPERAAVSADYMGSGCGARAALRHHSVLALLLLCAGLLPVRVGANPADHPQLLIQESDLPRLRHVCGVVAAGPADGDFGRFGRGAAHFNALRAHFVERDDSPPLPGELAAAAFLLRVTPEDPGVPGWARLLNATLRDPPWLTADPIELVLALDWGWNAIAREVRDSFLLAIRQRIAPLTLGDSPLDHVRFRSKLASLALAVCISASDDGSETWALLRNEVRQAARMYFDVTFPAFVAWRGMTPTTPAAAAHEECDAILAIEFAAALLKVDLWKAHRGDVGRWLEHYVMAYCAHPALQHQFSRDDDRDAPTVPIAAWAEMTPATAFLLAGRTADPAAASVAGRIEQSMARAGAPLSTAAWRWAPLVFDVVEGAACDPQTLPIARNLGGAVVFRGGGGLNDTVVWIEAGQPFLRDGQHFDAGHFLIRRAGELVVGGAQAVASEAVAAKGGEQRIGSRRVSSGFVQFCVSSAAHNTLLAWNPRRAANWRNAIFEPGGGQRPGEGCCDDFSLPLDQSPRHVGQLIAFGQSDDVAYAAMDLSAAYDPRDVQRYTREFVFLWRRALVVVDRVATVSDTVIPVVRVHLPAQPQFVAHDPPEDGRIAGGGATTGIWRCHPDDCLRWSDRRSAAWLTFAGPGKHGVFLAGGPASRLSVNDTAGTGRTYVGGADDGFEHLIRPIVSGRYENAWYRLGQPTLLPASLGRTPHWGCVETAGEGRAGLQLFVTVIVTGDAGERVVPTVQREAVDDGRTRVRLGHGPDAAVLELGGGQSCGGTVDVGDAPVAWVIPDAVTPDGEFRRLRGDARP